MTNRTLKYQELQHAGVDPSHLAAVVSADDGSVAAWSVGNQGSRPKEREGLNSDWILR